MLIDKLFLLLYNNYFTIVNDCDNTRLQCKQLPTYIHFSSTDPTITVAQIKLRKDKRKMEQTAAQKLEALKIK